MVYLVDDKGVLRDVMQLVIEGRPNALIADASGISVGTVEVHRARVFDKMNAGLAVEQADVLRQPPRPSGTG